MSLLSEKQKTDILGAIKMVTDTFFVTPVTFHHSTKGFDRFNETFSGTEENITVNCLVEYPSSGANTTEVEGAAQEVDYAVKVSMNYADAKEQGLHNEDDFTILSSTDDYFTTNGVKYKIKQVYLDGPLQKENVLLIVLGEKDNKVA